MDKTIEDDPVFTANHNMAKQFVLQKDNGMSNARKIIGTWRLVHSLEKDNEGNVTYPFGRDAIGTIIYSDSGYMDQVQKVL